MKKILALSLVALMIVAISACATDNTTQQTSATVQNTQPQTNSEPTQAESKSETDKSSAVITMEMAQDIALKHAGFEKSQVKDFQIEYEYDDLRYVYEIEFEKDKYEYEYVIDAVSGEILSFENEYDD